MSYKHKLVSELNWNEGSDQLSEQLEMFYNAICRAVRGVKHGVCWGCNTGIGPTGTRKYRETYLYIEGQQYALLKIGRGDYTAKRNGEGMFMVESRNIKNNKYNDTSSQYNLVCTKDLDKAVKNVKKYLKAYTLHEIADFSSYDVLLKVSGEVSNRRLAAGGAWHKVTDDNSLKAELRALVDTGYEFTSPALREKVVEWMGKEGERKHGLQGSRWVTYVQVREVHGEQILETIAVPDISRYADTRQQPVTVKASEADWELVAKLATINMVEDGTYVEGVGMKVTANSFWVEK